MSNSHTQCQIQILGERKKNILYALLGAEKILEVNFSDYSACQPMIKIKECQMWVREHYDNQIERIINQPQDADAAERR